MYNMEEDMRYVVTHDMWLRTTILFVEAAGPGRGMRKEEERAEQSGDGEKGGRRPTAGARATKERNKSPDIRYLFPCDIT